MTVVANLEDELVLRRNFERVMGDAAERARTHREARLGEARGSTGSSGRIPGGKAKALVELARKLDHLPRLRAAFEAGEIPCTKVRTVMRAATPESEERTEILDLREERGFLIYVAAATRVAARRARRGDELRAARPPRAHAALRRAGQSDKVEIVGPVRCLHSEAAKEEAPLSVSVAQADISIG